MPSTNTGGPSDARRKLPLHWIGVVPFAVFVLLFLIMPTMKIVVGAFQRTDGTFTLENIAGLFTASILSAYWISIKISLASAALGCLIGFAVAAAVVLGGL
ncbi:MAG: acriflavin resistance protein, partial [Rhizobiales bacterium]|nr:acriflavin resistance protein [Hyphomicrobiales bacterium]